MNRKTANLKVSYLGEGYDFPQLFKHSEIRILAEGLPISVECEVSESAAAWRASLKNVGAGLGASAARDLSFIRAKFPHAHWRDQIDAAIRLNGLQSGGWVDPIASAYEGLVVIVLHKNDWSVYPLRDLALVLHPYRRFYEIPVEPSGRNIVVNMWSRESARDEIQALTRQGTDALKKGDIVGFGKTVRQAWEIQKGWHPDIVSGEIAQMETVVSETGAWGWKVCGTGCFLVIGDAECHQRIGTHYTQFK